MKVKDLQQIASIYKEDNDILFYHEGKLFDLEVDRPFRWFDLPNKINRSTCAIALVLSGDLIPENKMSVNQQQNQVMNNILGITQYIIDSELIFEGWFTNFVAKSKGITRDEACELTSNDPELSHWIDTVIRELPSTGISGEYDSNVTNKHVNYSFDKERVVEVLRQIKEDGY